MKLRSEHDSEIARLAVPAFGTLIAGPLYVLADTAIVGHLGSEELSGLALATTVVLSVHGLLIFLAYGTTATVSRLIGARQTKRAASLAIQGLWLAAILGVAFAVIIALSADWLLKGLGATGPTLAFARTYLLISAAGLPFLLLGLAGAGAFYGRQNTRTPLIVAVASAVLNLVIELVLVFGFGYGVGASALSTVIAEGVAAVVYTVGIARWGREMGVTMTPVRAALWDLTRAGQPLVLRNVALRGTFTAATAVAARTGVAAVGGHQIGLQIWSALALALDAVAIAGQALTGRWLGSGAVQQARQAARRMIEVDVGLGVIMGLVVFVSRDWLAAGFSSDPEVVAAASFVLIWVAVSEPINGYVFALDGILIGAGDYLYLGRSMMGAAAVFWGLAIMISFAGAGLGWLWAALSLFMVLRAVALWWRWQSDAWMVTGA